MATQHISFIAKQLYRRSLAPARLDASSDFILRSRDTIPRKFLIHHLRSGSLRSTFSLGPPYGVNYTADYSERSVERPRTSLNGIVLTISCSNMSDVVFGTVPGHHVFELAGQISGGMPLEQVIQQDGVVCSVCVRHKTKLPDSADLLTRHVLAVVVVIDRLE